MGWIELRPHDPAWKETFEAERERIRALAETDLLGVFHIGSTAVPDLPAKPIVDVLAVYAATPGVHDAKEALLAEYRIHRDERDRVVLLREEADPTITLHLRPRSVEGWRDQFVFRELLLDDPHARDVYEAAKRAAAAEHPDDGEAYTAAKEPVIESLTERAYEEGYDERLPDFARDR